MYLFCIYFFWYKFVNGLYQEEPSVSLQIPNNEFCSVVQPDYSPEYSYRRNLYDGFKLGYSLELLGLFQYHWPSIVLLQTS